MQKSILITGGTGFLGQEIIKQLCQRDEQVVGLGHSENRLKDNILKFKNIKFYCVDISSNTNEIDEVIKEHQITHIIHSAAMKHVGICEKNPYRAIEVNVIGSKNIIDIAVKNNVKNVIGVSTDKAIKPKCVYGTTKLLMEKMLLEKKYSVFRGVNFLFSDGSVLDLWDRNRRQGKEIGVNVKNTIRYFVSIENVASQILENLDNNGVSFFPEYCYKVYLRDLAKAFCKYHDYYKTVDYHDSSVEKIEEDIPDNMKVFETNVEKITSLFEKHYKKEKI